MHQFQEAILLIYYCKDQVFEDCTWWEVEDELELIKQQSQLAKTRRNRAETAFLAQSDHVIDQAPDVKLLPNMISKDSIRANRRAEKKEERHQNAWQLHEDPVNKSEKISDDLNDKESYVPPPSYTQILLDRLNKENDKEN